MDPQALEELTASVKTYGIIQPLLFRVDADSSNLIIVAGERRCEAAKKAGLTEAPAILVEGKHGEIALVENLLRQDLTAVDPAAWTEEEKTAFAAALGELKKTILAMLKPKPATLA